MCELCVCLICTLHTVDVCACMLIHAVCGHVSIICVYVRTIYLCMHMYVIYVDEC